MPTFHGFRRPTYTPVPDEVFDELLPDLGEAEIKALLYIIRRTFGFKKDADAISFNQFLKGVTTKEGTVLDRGCGIKKASNLSKALQSLEAKGIIVATKQDTTAGDKATTVYALHFIGEVLPQKEYPTPEEGVPVLPQKELQETVIQEIAIQKIYPSNTRKAQNDGFDITKSIGSANNHTEQERLTHNEGVGASQHHSTPNGRNIEENEKYKHFAAAQKTDQMLRPAEPERKGSLAHIGQTVQGRLPMAPSAVSAADARDAIEHYLRETAVKLHDEAPLKSSTTRAFNLYERSGVDFSTFYTLMYDAEKEALHHTATIKKLTAKGYKNRMAYFFAILEDKLGLREKPLQNGPQSP